MKNRKQKAFIAAFTATAVITAPLASEANTGAQDFLDDALEYINKRSNEISVTTADIQGLLNKYDMGSEEFQSYIDTKGLASIGPAGTADAIENLEWLLGYLEYRGPIKLYEATYAALYANRNALLLSQYEALFTQYEELYDGAAYVKDADIMTDLLDELKEAAYKYEASLFQKRLDALSESTITEEQLTQFQSEYDDLPMEIQEYITDIEKLETLNEYLMNKPFEEEAAAVLKMLGELNPNTVTLAQVEAVQDAYYSLSFEAQEIFGDDTKIQTMYTAALKNIAKPIQKLIDELSELTVTFEKLDAIDTLYMDLDPAVYDVIENYEKVEELAAFLMEQEMLALELGQLIGQLSVDSTKEEVQAALDQFNQLPIIAQTFMDKEATQELQSLMIEFDIPGNLGVGVGAQYIEALIAKVWKSPNFVTDYTAAQAAYDAAAADVKKAVTNEASLANYKKLASAWGAKTVLREAESTVATNKIWTVSLSNAVKNTSANLAKVAVYDQTGNKVSTSVKANNNQLIISAPASKYKAGTSYVLIIEDGLENKNNTTLKNGIWHYFDAE